MSSLASKLQEVSVEPPVKSPRSPCFPLYGWGDVEDLRAVESLKASGAEWPQVQEVVDEAAGVDQPLPLGKFIRHWRTQCSCWNNVREMLR